MEHFLPDKVKEKSLILQGKFPACIFNRVQDVKSTDLVLYYAEHMYIKKTPGWSEGQSPGANDMEVILILPQYLNGGK